MLYTITDGSFTAKIDSLGAQLVSLTGPDGFEYIWVGDKAYWGGHAPVLFPIVGALREGKTQIGGKWYHMGRHGFARTSGFTAEEEPAGNSVALTLRASDETKEAYPFDFAFTVTYTLENGGLTTTFTVENTGGVPLPFSVGGHPGFNLPVGEEAAFEDYTLQFSQAETQRCPVIDLTTGLIDWDRHAFTMENQTEVPLRHSLFYQDALVFEGLNSHIIRIVNKATGKGIEMDFSGFPLLGVWSAVNDGPYVCLEPWTGCATLQSEGDVFEKKKGMAALAPGEKSVHRFLVKVLRP